jgi:hypothetical protein
MKNGIGKEGGGGGAAASGGGSGRAPRAIASLERFTTVTDLFVDGVQPSALASWAGGGEACEGAGEGTANGCTRGEESEGCSSQDESDGEGEEEDGEEEADGPPVTYALHSQFGSDDFASLLRVEILTPPPLVRFLEWCRTCAPQTFGKSEALDAAGHGVGVETVAAALDLLEHHGWCGRVEHSKRGHAKALRKGSKGKAGPKRSRGEGDGLPPPKRKRERQPTAAGGRPVAAGSGRNGAPM